MKAATFLAFLAALVALPIAHAVLPTQDEINAGKPKLTLAFPHWQKYADIWTNINGTGKEGGKKFTLEELEKSFDALAGEEIPNGEHLYIKFGDIDLAGKFYNGTRHYWDSYPPRLIFSYALTTASGQVLKSGTADIKDEMYNHGLMGLPLDGGDPRHFERELLRNWMKSDLLRPVAAR